MVHSSFSSSDPGYRRRRRTRGFTLLEVLLVIAIMSLIAAVLIGGSARLINDEPVAAQDIFWKAVQEARKAAIRSGHDMRLRFDKEKKQFVVVDGIAPARLAADGFTREEVPVKVLPIPVREANEDLAVDFLAAGRTGNVALIGGVVVETQPISYVSFYSDGTCSPFRVQFFRYGSASTLSIDPWTCAPVLPAVDPNAPPS